MDSDNRLVGVLYVMDVLGISKPAAYEKIRKLNAELRQQGVKTIPGKVNLAYLNERYFSIPNGKDGIGGCK